MSSFDTTPLNVYLISFFSLAVIAVVFAIVVVATEVGRHGRTSTAGQPAEARTNETLDGTEIQLARY